MSDRHAVYNLVFTLLTMDFALRIWPFRLDFISQTDVGENAMFLTPNKHLKMEERGRESAA